MDSRKAVTVSELIQKETLVNLTPEIDMDSIEITTSDINRPALQLTGFFKNFSSERIQIIGKVEYDYLESLSEEERRSRYDALTRYRMPCIIYARGLMPDNAMIASCKANNIPLLVSQKVTTDLSAALIRWLKMKMAPEVTVHGVLVDVYGEGVLMTGVSGIGKSEVALELIRRGHRLVADDTVIIRQIDDDTLIGTASEITRHFLEIRGIGIVNVREMFGVESIRDTKAIDMIIHMEDWNDQSEFDRLGLEEHFTKIIEKDVITYNIPIRPGRNVAIIVEGAAVNNRAKKMGYNAAEALSDRLTEKMAEDEG
ncbi:MAG: HPr(Ser) kinase/phosphatase [Anaerovoracaceae bacterium]|jgi:HPr kinase/phosphorylase